MKWYVLEAKPANLWMKMLAKRIVRAAALTRLLPRGPAIWRVMLALLGELAWERRHTICPLPNDHPCARAGKEPCRSEASSLEKEQA